MVFPAFLPPFLFFYITLLATPCIYFPFYLEEEVELFLLWFCFPFLFSQEHSMVHGSGRFVCRFLAWYLVFLYV